MDPQARRIACRLLRYTVAMAAALAAPAVLQAAFVLHPGALSASDAHLAMSLALAGTAVGVPAMLKALVHSVSPE